MFVSLFPCNFLVEFRCKKLSVTSSSQKHVWFKFTKTCKGMFVQEPTLHVNLLREMTSPLGNPATDKFNMYAHQMSCIENYPPDSCNFVRRPILLKEHLSAQLIVTCPKAVYSL